MDVMTDSEAERLEHQIDAVQWLIVQCSDDFVRAWLIQRREQIKSAGGTPNRP